MIRFHVIDNQVIDIPVTDDRFNFIKIILDKLSFDRINECNLFVVNQIGVIGDSIRDGPDIFKKLGSTVIKSEKIYVIGKFNLMHNVNFYITVQKKSDHKNTNISELGQGMIPFNQTQILYSRPNFISSYTFCTIGYFNLIYLFSH